MNQEQLELQKSHLSKNPKVVLANYRNTLRNMPGFEDDYEDWTEGDFTYGNGVAWLGQQNKSVICPSPRHDPDLPKRPQYTVSFMRKHLPASVFFELFSDYRERVDHDSNEIKIPRGRVEKEARKIDEVLENKISDTSMSQKVKKVLSSNRGKLEIPSNFTSMKNFLVGEKERYKPPVQKASMIHRDIPDYTVMVEE